MEYIELCTRSALLMLFQTTCILDNPNPQVQVTDTPLTQWIRHHSKAGKDVSLVVEKLPLTKRRIFTPVGTIGSLSISMMIYLVLTCPNWLDIECKVGLWSISKSSCEPPHNYYNATGRTLNRNLCDKLQKLWNAWSNYLASAVSYLLPLLSGSRHRSLGAHRRPKA